MYHPIYHFQIAFKTKELLKPQPHPNHPQVRGMLHYYFQAGKIIKQYLEITDANLRLVDQAMITTDFYRHNHQFYQTYFPELIQPSLQTLTRHQLSPEQIKTVNNYFRKSFRTIKSQYALLAGSNISGAKADGFKSPIRCFSDSYQNINLTNVFDHYRYNPVQIDPHHLDIQETISLDYLLNHQQILPHFASYFYQANPSYRPYYQFQQNRQFNFPAAQLKTISQ